MTRAKAIGMKLLEVSRKLGISHQLILIRFFHERLLFRVSVSEYKNNLCLKGGTLLYSLQGNEARPTIDIDFSGQKLSNDIEIIKNIFKQILSLQCNDEVVFDVENIDLTPINENNQYLGIRIKVMAILANIKQFVQLDIGFGDVITPASISINYPVLLEEFDAPVLQAYTIETVVAEKLQAIIVLAQLNSRMKDFYDIYTLINVKSINLEILKDAIEQTFNNRQTRVNFDSVVFSKDFYQDANRNKMWIAYLKKINIDNISFETVVESINQLVQNIFRKNY
ncbi:MAG TPA: nucleotidyl transferase AbiEii/AbiGii toxin family protein [Bacteroidales bacterium]|nr:nucleotidyl transferase AbiEii/AbiGii toxin family protein [Bacteroidales bacterium]HQL69548.1 nucleotidyl transferase AbiEii/AbiGii toxin family protein [Bacteroidales bacterium]